MWAINYPINIVTTKNSWYEQSALKLKEHLIKNNFNCNILYDYEDITANALVFYLSYQKIVPLSFIEKSYKSLVVHASDLPQGKGFSPWVWQILEGKHEIPLCLFEIDAGADTGPIVKKINFKLKGNELLDEIRMILAQEINQLVFEYLSAVEQPPSKPQQGAATYYRKRSAADSELDVKRTLEEQFNLLRVVDNENYPAFFLYKNRKYILKIEAVNA